MVVVLIITHIIIIIVPNAVRNPNGSVVIKNVQPLAWFGQFFDCHVYKDNRSLVTQNDVNADSQAVIEIKPILLFGVTSNVQVGPTFTAFEITSAPFEVDLSDFPNGVEVTLKQAPGGGRFYFSSDVLKN